MQTLGKIAVFVLFAVVFALFAASEVFAAEVQNIRLGNQNGASARLVLDLTDRPSHEVLLLKNPYRVVIDLEKTTIAVPENKIPKTSNIVKDLRTGKTPKGAARIVVETKDSAIVKKAFFLPPQGGFNWRLVVDITNASQDDFEKAKAQNPKPQPTASPTQTEISAKDAAAELEKLKKPLAEKPLIVLDPGHGGKDPGAISASGYYEKHITLKMAKELKQTLEATGKYRVMLTRSDDRSLALRSRVKIARDAKADLFISIHADSAEEDKLTVARARKIQRFLSQPFHVAEVFTGAPGRYVQLADTIKGFKGILEGKYDHMPEQAFYMVGTIEEAEEKAKKLEAEANK